MEVLPGLHDYVQDIAGQLNGRLELAERRRHGQRIARVRHPHAFDLTEGLVRRKYSRENIELILGKNFQRALTAIWA